MYSKVFLIVVAILSLSGVLGSGLDELVLGNAIMAGSGCPIGTATAWKGDDDSIFVGFQNYASLANGTNTFERVSCNLALPVEIPQGISVGISAITYYGFAHVPNKEGSSAQFSRNYFFSGNTGKTLKTNYEQGYLGSLHVQDTIGTVTWSECGASTIYRVNSALTSRKAASTEAITYIGLEGAISKPLIQITIRTRSC